MQFQNTFQDAKCKRIFDEVNAFVGDFLGDYNLELETNKPIHKGKEIFDPVWNTISLSPVEVFLIDSPLIQRLKKIKQLGYAYQVYTNADYNRFSHTIGVVETSTRISKVIEKKVPTGKTDEKINFIELVRIAAIMHDSGHMFFSHVSEKFFLHNKNFRRNKEVIEALTFFSEKVSERVALHEMFSVMIVNSEHFFKFLEIVYFDKSLGDDDRKTIIDYISGMIVGIAIDKKILPYSKVIKGTIDADRMDYLSRDSFTTKVPLTVDVSRLISKISVIEIPSFTPSSVWNDEKSGPFYAMAIQYSAQRLIWQLYLARTIMYQSIYFHHKKLTAETILDKALERIFSLLPEGQLSFSYILSLNDDAFGEYFSYILSIRDKMDEPAFVEASNLVERLKKRSFYKRIASFSKENITSDSPTLYDRFKVHVIENPFSIKYMSFVEELSKEYAEILRAMGKSPSGTPHFMFIQAGWNWETESGIPIDIGDGHYKMSTDLFKETPTIGEENIQKQYYLLTDQNDRELVYLALEKYLFRARGFVLTAATYFCAKFNTEQLHKLRMRLLEKGYYRDVLGLLPDKIVMNLMDTNIFNEVVKKYRTFVGANKSFVDEKSLLVFLRQFLRLKVTGEEMRIILDGILRMLNGATYVSRDFFVTAMSGLIAQVDTGEKRCAIANLGGVFDSSNRLYWYFNDMKIDEKFECLSNVESALTFANENDCGICFFDDGAYSGTQVVSIFKELLGIKDEKTDETHVWELSDTCKDILKKVKITLAYICFNETNRDAILKELKKVGISNIEIIYKYDMSKKVFDEGTTWFKDNTQRGLLKESLYTIGHEIMQSEKSGKPETWSDDRIKKAALGYNDSQQMVIFDVNVPTYTISPFWANGTFMDKPWKGLFQRADNSKKSKKI
ncbi:MAG: HD domain-containing protein [Defluviitaleaceae bacterium]|nr:HD domain-containing protein [Defluviitaleaceae bacterium]